MDNEQKVDEGTANIAKFMPSAEQVLVELSSARRMDDCFGKEGIFARLFARTMEAMLEAELSAHLGYERYEAKGRKSGNNRNGHRKKTVKSSGGGETEIAVPREVCDDVPFGTGSSNPKSSANTRAARTNAKIRAGPCTPRA